MKIITTYILLLSLSLYSFNSYSSDTGLFDKKNCFNNITHNFQTWRNFIKEKNNKGTHHKKRVQMVMNWFDNRFNENDFNRYKSKLECISFKYNVGEEIVDGFMIKPKALSKDLPALIYNRGGNRTFSAVNFASKMLNLFPIAEKGFVIIGSQYISSGDKTKAMTDEFGGKDVNAVLKLLDLLPHIKYVDLDNIGMFGASRGGMETLLALKKSKRLKAVATIGGVSDLFKSIEERPKMERVFKATIPNYDQNKEVELRKRSSIYWVDKLPKNVPILLMHGENDKRVSVEQSISLANVLSKNGYVNKLIIYPQDDHMLNKNRAKAHSELVNWFNLYLKQ